jgi:inositol oxygenase
LSIFDLWLDLCSREKFFSVNVLKTKTWNDHSEFDAAKDKAQFRQYEDACERVKGFYKEQHGMQRDTVQCEAAF